ncbi:MAG TPA: bifunctional riboflavin kinase/FAD synthetase [bacterium]|nr:bifunctional riboflavin kinase/FAD synthetase [bacterium]
MRIYHNLKDVPKNEKISLAIGNFDGVHQGHLQIIEKCRKNGGSCTLLTFDVHPREYLYPGFAPRLLTLKHEKYAFLKHAGVDIVIELPFSQYCSIDPIKFLGILDRELQLDSITIGFNFFFGQNQKGNADLMFWWGRSTGVRINVVPPIIKNGMRVSSTIVREFLATGEMWNAFSFLAYPYVISGKVIEGRRIGRTIDFPTLNLDVPPKIIPPEGVYFTRTVLENETFFSLTNIGANPTIDSEEKTKRIETWIANGNIDEMYGRNIAVYFYKKVRDEIRFSSKEKLSEMINHDRVQLEQFKNANKFDDLPDIF